MEELRLVGTTEGGDALVLERVEGDRFLLPLDRAVKDAADRAPERPGSDERAAAPDHHVRVVDPAHAPRRTGGLAPGAFERATGMGRAAPELRGVRALIGEGVLVRPSDLEQPGPEEVKRVDETGLVRTARAHLSAGEIQGRLRAGETVDAVAASAGAPVDWVKRLEATVDRERLVLVGQMLHERLERSGAGRSALTIGDAILANLSARGISEEFLESGWQASRGPSGPWRVRLTYMQGGTERHAEWAYDPRTRTVRALDEVAARLAWISRGEHASA